MEIWRRHYTLYPTLYLNSIKMGFIFLIPPYLTFRSLKNLLSTGTESHLSTIKL